MAQIEPFQQFFQQEFEEQSKPNVCSSTFAVDFQQQQNNNNEFFFPILSNNNTSGNSKSYNNNNSNQLFNKKSSFSMIFNNNMNCSENNTNNNQQDMLISQIEDQNLDDLFKQQSDHFVPSMNMFDTCQQQFLQPPTLNTQQYTQQQQQQIMLQQQQCSIKSTNFNNQNNNNNIYLENKNISKNLKIEVEEQQKQENDDIMINNNNNGNILSSSEDELEIEQDSTQDQIFFELPDFDLQSAAGFTVPEEEENNDKKPKNQNKKNTIIAIEKAQEKEEKQQQQLQLQQQSNDDNNNKKIWKVTHKISKKKQQRDYDKNICRYLARQIVRCFVDRSYKSKVQELCAQFLEKNESANAVNNKNIVNENIFENTNNNIVLENSPEVANINQQQQSEELYKCEQQKTYKTQIQQSIGKTVISTTHNNQEDSISQQTLVSSNDNINIDNNNISNLQQQQKKQHQISELYGSSTQYLLSKIEFISGQRAFQELLVIEEQEQYESEKRIFRAYTEWFLRERAFRYIITGAMSDKKSYLKFKNEILLFYVRKPETWNANIAKKNRRK